MHGPHGPHDDMQGGPGGRRGGFRGMGGPPPWGFGGFRGEFTGRGPRAGRGNIRQAILVLLSEEPRHGYQIMQILEERSGGAWRPSPGSIYPTLQALEDEGMITAELIDGKKVFSLTEAGKGYCAASASSEAPWESFRGGPREQLQGFREQIFQLGAAVMQVAQGGTPEQLEQAKTIVTEAKKKIYRLLAEEA
ncbi:MAG: PadR family transcriptional regulator [Acidimicrobiales bacterium]